MSRYRKTTASVLISALLLTSLAPGATAASEPASRLAIYDDALQDSFADYSWATHNLAQSAVVRSGARAIELNPSGDGALYFYKDRVVSVDDYPVLEFWVHGGSAGGQKLRLVLQSGGQPVAAVESGRLLPGGQLAAGAWQRVQVPLDSLAIPYGIFDGIMVQGASAGAQAPVYIDDMALVRPKGTARLSSLAATPSSATLKVGEKLPLRVAATYEDGTTTDVTPYAAWSADRPERAKVEGGVLEALAAGTTVLTATYQGKTTRVTAEIAALEPAPGPNPPPSGQTPPDGTPETGNTPFATIYDDALNASYTDYSWAQHELDQRTVVHSGASAIRFDPSGQGGLYLYKGDGPVWTKEYEKLELWVHGGVTGGQQVDVKFNAGGETVATTKLASWLDGDSVPAGQWAKATIPLAELKLKEGLFDALLFQGAEGAAVQAPVYLDDIRLLGKYVAPPELRELVLSQYQMVLAPGDTSAFGLTANYSNGASEEAAARAAWTSSDTSVLTVQGGVLQAAGEGVAKVTATLSGQTASAYVQVTKVVPLPVYGDALAPGFTDWSWGTRDLNAASPVYAGSRSVAFAAKGYEGFWFHKDGEPFDTSRMYGLRFHVYGGGSGGQKLKVVLMDGRNFAADMELDRVLPPGGLPAGQWVEAKVKLADLGISNPTFDGIVIQAWGEQDQGTVYFDEMQVLQNASVVTLPEPDLPKVAVSIDANAGRRAVSPDIFGVNFEDQPTQGGTQMTFPIRRWGGNQMTRYNWELDTTNRGGDWYFLNVPYDPDGTGKSLADQFITKSKAEQTKVLLQVPTIGWTPKSRDVSWSFSIDKYGPQRGNECDYGEAWCRRDAGNGLLPDGQTHVTGNDPFDTSKRVGPEFIGRWIDHLKQAYGGYVRHYALDNEPALWAYSHWDVHPELTTYDEIWKYTTDYGSMIKAKDPEAVVYGPVAWGWCEYFYSAKDGCYGGGEDMKAHDNKPFLEWYLSKVQGHAQQTGVRLVDALDIHYYPAEADVAFSSDESPAMTKRRFNALKSLYDPTFQDASSWIQEPVYLIPRMRDIIERNAPGTKLAITEYNFGDGSGIGSGLAQAEALAIFAREGVDVATRWGALLADTPLEDAFKLYLNYDGNGAKIEGDAVQTVSSNADAVGAYTIVSPQGGAYVLLFNKDTAPRTAEVSTGLSLNGSAELYRFDGRQRLQASGEAAVQDGRLAVKLPARSATLVVVK